MVLNHKALQVPGGKEIQTLPGEKRSCQVVFGKPRASWNARSDRDTDCQEVNNGFAWIISG